MQTVKEYFDTAGTSAIFTNVVSDVATWSGINGLTADDIRYAIIEKFGGMYINGTPTIAGFTRATTLWNKARTYYFEGLYNSTQYEYNPIDSVDETTEQTILRTPNLTHGHTGSQTDTDTRKIELTHGHTVNVTTSGTSSAESSEDSSGSDSSTNTHSVTTYNSDTFVNDNKDVKSGTNSNEVSSESSGSTSGTSATTNAGKDTTQNSGGTAKQTTYTNTETGNERTVITTTREGKVGVTAIQRLVELERQIRDIDIFEIWIERFSERFFIPIYETEEF